LVTAAQKLVKKIPVSVIPKRDLQAQLHSYFTVTGKNILCFDELSTKILAFQFAAPGLGGPACPMPLRERPVAHQHAAVVHQGARSRDDPPLS
jgi:hypothetical protein